MITLTLKTGTIVLPNGFDIDLTDPENCVITETGLLNEFKKPEYISDTIPNLKHGDVSRQVREKFGRVGNQALVIAHTYGSIWSALDNQGWKGQIVQIGKRKFDVVRTA
jgi:hypothetical protein